MIQPTPYPPSPRHPIAQATARSPRVPATLAVAGLGIAAAVAATGTVLQITSYRMLAVPGASPSEVNSAALLTLLAVGLSVAAGLFAAVTFIVWLHRSRANLDAWGVRDLTWSRGWAIGGWFVPVASLVIPLVVVSETDRASETEAARADHRPPSGEGRAIFVWWAVTWTLSGVVGGLATLAGAFLEAGTPAERATHITLFNAVAYGNAVVTIIAAVSAILLVRSVSSHQERVLNAVVRHDS